MDTHVSWLLNYWPEPEPWKLYECYVTPFDDVFVRDIGYFSNQTGEMLQLSISVVK